jgi:hypothetical protein
VHLPPYRFPVGLCTFEKRVGVELGVFADASKEVAIGLAGTRLYVVKPLLEALVPSNIAHTYVTFIHVNLCMFIRETSRGKDSVT